MAGLTDRFAGRLQFGTAGLRGQVGAGPNRMNRAVVRAATAALAEWLRERGPGAAPAAVPASERRVRQTETPGRSTHAAVFRLDGRDGSSHRM